MLRVPPLAFTANAEDNTFHPGRCAVITCGDTKIGKIGQLHPALKASKHEPDIYLAELNIDAMTLLAKTEPTFASLPKFPAMTRDLALVCDESVTHAALQAAIIGAAGELLESVALFDVYTGTGIADGQKSLAYTLTLRSADRTLTDDDADKVVAQILKAISPIAALR